MELIGLLDSPYVRRVAVSLLALELPFAHRPISVFRGIEAFRRINPVVKAPTLVADDGTVLMESTLILQHAEALARPRTLMPADTAALTRSLGRLGLALAGCEKAVQIVYERALRPPEKRHAPWVERITAQMQAAFAALDADLAAAPPDAASCRTLGQAGITVAVVWDFAQRSVGDDLPAAAHPALQVLSAAAEALPEFRAAPFGDGPVAGPG
jgi:glutathione S-transferase